MEPKFTYNHNDPEITEGEVVVNKFPSIIIPKSSHQRIMDYVDACDMEISGFAETSYDAEENTIRIGEVYLLKQEVSAAETEMDEEAIAQHMLEFMVIGKTQLPNCWWHSHVNMGVFWSSTDWNTINTLKNNSYFVSIVFNKRRELRALLRVFGVTQVTVDDIAVTVETDARDIPEDIKKEVAEKVTQKVWTYQNAWNWNGEKKGRKYKKFLKRQRELGNVGPAFQPASLPAAEGAATDADALYGFDDPDSYYRGDVVHAPDPIILPRRQKDIILPSVSRSGGFREELYFAKTGEKKGAK